MKEKKKHANRDIAEVQTSILASIVLSIFNSCHVKVDTLHSLESTFPTFQNISISLPGYNNKTKLQYLMKVTTLNIKNMKTISPCGDIFEPFASSSSDAPLWCAHNKSRSKISNSFKHNTKRTKALRPYMTCSSRCPTRCSMVVCDRNVI